MRLHWAFLSLSVGFCVLNDLYKVQAKCVVTQKCVNPDNLPDYDACIPEAYKTSVDPQPMIGEGWANVTGGGICSSDEDCHDKGKCLRGKCECNKDGVTAGAHCNEISIQCPQYKDSACCSWQQNQGLAENFKLLSSVFGKNEAGGCDACAANLMAFWCGLNCSPKQNEFMKMHLPFPSINYRPDPMTGEENVTVLELNVVMDKSFTCKLFDSCKNTAIASMTEGMKSSLGFLKYQAQTGAIGHGEYIHLSFNSNNKSSYSDHVLKCSNYSEVDTIFSKLPAQAQILKSIAQKNATRQCPCGACRETCNSKSDDDFHIKLVKDPISIWAGLNVKLVSGIYGGFMIVIVFVKWTRG